MPTVYPDQAVTGWSRVDLRFSGGRVHVVPNGDYFEHTIDEEGDAITCKCHWLLDDGIVVHDAADGRVAFENGERKPS